MKKLATIALMFTTLSGCATARFVTARTWVGADTLYVAYTEYEKRIFTETFEAKLLRCNRQPDNALQCTPEEQVNALLNAGSSSKK